MKIIEFYKTNEEYGCFSNLSKHRIYYRGPWKTSEHCYQAMKFKGVSIDSVTKISQAKTAFDAAKLGRTLSPIREDWENVKLDFMYEILIAKFTQNHDIREVLFSTKEAILIEVSPYDSFWGSGSDDTGENHLGKTLMRVRENLLVKYKCFLDKIPPWLKYKEYEENDIRWRMGVGESDLTEWSLWFDGLSKTQKNIYLEKYENPWRL